MGYVGTTEHCCQLDEIGGFDAYEEDAYQVAEDEWYDEHGRKADAFPPDNLKITADHFVAAIERDMHPNMSHFATTSEDQTKAVKALRSLGFRKVGVFPGSTNRPITMWLRARVVVPKKKGGTNARSVRQRTQRQGTCKRA